MPPLPPLIAARRVQGYTFNAWKHYRVKSPMKVAINGIDLYFIDSGMTNGVDAYAEGFVRTAFAPQSITAKPEVVKKTRESIQSNSTLGISGTLLALAGRTDTTASLPSIKVPTLILVGEHDTITPPLASQEMHDKIPNSEFHVISNAAYMSPRKP